MSTKQEWVDYLKSNNTTGMTDAQINAQAKANANKKLTVPMTISFGNLPSGSSGSVGNADVANSTYDVSGMNLPIKFKDPTKVNGQQLYDSLVKLATTNPSAWIPIKYALAQSHYYSSNVDFSNPNFQSEDKTAVTDFLTNLTKTNSNLSPGEKPTPVISFLSQQQKLANMFGGASSRQVVQKVTVPNELDLKKIADNAFRSALGKPATEAQQKAFAKSFQNSVMAVARAQAVQTATASAPQIPTAAQSQQALATATPATPEQGMANIQKAATVQPKTSVVLQQTQQAPDAQVAAEQAAIQAAPASAASQNVSNALDAMFKSLARNA